MTETKKLSHLIDKHRQAVEAVGEEMERLWPEGAEVVVKLCHHQKRLSPAVVMRAQPCFHGGAYLQVRLYESKTPYSGVRSVHWKDVYDA